MMKKKALNLFSLLSALLLLATPLSAQIIVDNDDGSPDYTELGSWTTSGSTGYNGGTYRFASAGADASATWTADVPSAGDYDVSVIYKAGTNRATSVQYDISTDSGTQTVFVDQTSSDLVWVNLGNFSLDAGANTVTLDALGSSGGDVVIADAVKFESSSSGPSEDPAEMRVAPIVVFDDIDDTASIQAWVDEIANLQYNAIAIHTRYRGDATYFPNKTDSTYPNNEPRSSQAGSIDVLEEFVTRGHAAGLKVFAYVNTHLVTDGSDTHPDSNHVVNTHPEWRTYAWNNGNPVVQDTSHVSEGLWMDPAVPEYRQYLQNICGDIMMNYNADGIILDRIRYPQTTWTRTDSDFGHHPDAWAEFNSIYGKDPHPDDSDWITYRQNKITDTVQAIYNTITSIDSDHILLAYPIGRFNDAINFNYQDWPVWMSNGIVDGVFPQIYTSDDSSFSSRADTHRNAYSGERLLGVATMAWQSGIDVENQINIARNKNFIGVSPWRHGVMGNLGYFTDIQNAFPGIAPWPDMPWKGQTDTTPPAAPTNLSATAGDATVDLDWDDNTESDLSGYNVYRSTTSGGSYNSIATGVGVSNYTDNSVTNDTTYYYVVTAVDTSSNESANSNEVSATPTAPSASTMHVDSITVNDVNVGQGNKVGEATVTILDNTGSPVSGATVSGTFSGDYNESDSANTDNSGVAVLTTASTAKGKITFTFCVDDVTHASLTYDSTSNTETCDSQ